MRALPRTAPHFRAVASRFSEEMRICWRRSVMLSQRFTVRVVIILLIWCVLAALLGAVGMFASLHPPVPQVILFCLVAFLLIAYGFSSEFRLWISSVPLAWLVSVHLVRFVGFYFLWLYEQRQLPFAFAVLGGWGDIVVATLALVLLILRPPSRVIYHVWNTLGLADILFVVSTATRLALADPASMATLLRFPLSLLPTFIVPLIIFTHVVIFLRLRDHALNRRR
jgi:hypothetical protein